MLPREHGTVINISSIAGRKTFPTMWGMSATSLLSTESRRTSGPEVAGRNVRISIVARARWKLNCSAIRRRAMSLPVTRRGSRASVEPLMPKQWSKRFRLSRPAAVGLRAKVVIANTLQVDWDAMPRAAMLCVAYPGGNCRHADKPMFAAGEHCRAN